MAKPKKSRGIGLKKERFQKELQKHVDWLPVFEACFKGSRFRFLLLLESLIGLNLIIGREHCSFKKNRNNYQQLTHVVLYMLGIVLSTLLI